jgi:hypothetical protein
MRDALSNPARMAAIATRARRLVERRYSWERTVRVLEGVYGRSSRVVNQPANLKDVDSVTPATKESAAERRS